MVIFATHFPIDNKHGMYFLKMYQHRSYVIALKNAPILEGMVFQNPDNQIIGQVVEEDVGFGPENLGVPTKEIWERVEKSLGAVRMTKYRNHSPNKLSGGQKRRVAIAGVVAMRPKCIVLDEPTAMLDPRGRKEVIDTIYRLNKEKGITIVLITHYMEEAESLSDEIAVMVKGELKAVGTLEELKKLTGTEKLEDAFVKIVEEM